MSTRNGNLLEVRDLKTYFQTQDGTVKAVDGVTFNLRRGETLGIVGESGSGKSVTTLSIIRLIDTPISKQLMEMTMLHLGHSKAQAYAHAVKMLETVGIPDARKRADDYPHEFSGGMRQRVMIAMALSCRPELLIADEPSTALDVTIQAQILELIKTLKRETGTSVILITHDLGVVAGMTDHVVVMYAGKIFEQASTRELFALPGNPYTKGLLRSVPDPTSERGTLYQITGLPPDVAHLPPGCPFAPRCDRVEEICHREFPPVVQLTSDHTSLCHFAGDVYQESVRDRETKLAQDARGAETVVDK
jgi:oligopeptide transport system ATP-binding protein